MTKLFSKLNLTKLFYIFPQQDQETIIPQKSFTIIVIHSPMLKPTRVDLREGISQIVECVGVETPHCGNVEMWWIHIVKMWRCGGSTFLVWRSTLISNLSKN